MQKETIEIEWFNLSEQIPSLVDATYLVKLQDNTVDFANIGIVSYEKGKNGIGFVDTYQGQPFSSPVALWARSPFT